MPCLFSQSIRRCTSPITSGPIPSPGRSSSLWVAMVYHLVQLVMPGLVPGIHVLLPQQGQDVDGRDKPGHDDQYRCAPSAKAPEADWQGAENGARMAGNEQPAAPKKAAR